ncbi:helix-turn-helix domain-containing protein [Aminobacter sp. HY435]|uniref:helix-turn-helix domain-containing protein n=1 Tax=Aminobacter sp. HY435 TaxID=2970917 RepID=UPI0022B95106|nr:AraC family transcriptional regulator [Aminobacter sp. HY435]
MASGQASKIAVECATPAPMEIVRRRPSPQLIGLVTEFIGYRELVAGHSRQTEAASLTVPLVISFGEAFAIGLSRAPGDNDRFASFAAGLHPGPVVIDSYGRSSCIQVNFTPLGARRFFAMPMHELASRMVELDDVLGHAGRALRERLGAESDWHRRLDLAESFVIRRLAAATPTSAEVHGAFQAIVVSGGRARISALARDIGWSRKHLAHRFAEQVGLGPKAVARIVRFTRADSLSRRLGPTDWADLAAECGYADQAHLVREFREMSGTPPALRSPS